MNRRELLSKAGGVLLFSFAPWQIAYGAKMIDVRMWPAHEYTRITLEHDAPLKFKHFMVRSAHPLRFVVDIQGLEFTKQLKKMIEAVKPDDPYIAAIRIGQFQPNVVRLVMDLKVDAKPEVFLLRPYDKFKYRLVFDIYPTHPKDEISRLIQSADNDTPSITDNTQNQAQATDGENDALSALINQLTGAGSSVSTNEQVAQSNDKGQSTQQIASSTQSSKSKDKGSGVASSSKSSDKSTSSSASTSNKGSNSSSSASAGSKKNTQIAKTNQEIIIVVDPGHGGEDSGAIGPRKTMEKTVVLQIARRLAQLINAEPNMKAIMTRNSDHFVSLGNRVRIARKAKAHLLISIHADAWIKSSARGSSVFALSKRGATSAAARWLAQNQNASDLIGGINSTKIDKDVASIVVDMTSNWKIGYSLNLGAHVLNELDEISHLHKGHVEQASFAVLKGQGIPSILVETGFISNPQEEKLLRNSMHQQMLAQAILRGIKNQLKADPSLISM